jgi:type IX secretion system PorP/SprF family membrane protein
LWLYGNNFYLGTSATQILSNSINFDNSIVEHNILYKHYFFTAAYKFNVTQQISVVPSIMAMWLKPSPGALDFSMRAIYENRFWVGGSYRQNKKFAILTGVTINHIFDAGYAYDRGVSSFNGIDRGNHEVMIGIRIFNRAKILCPQNLW